jgi:hypothetical protein
MAMNRVFSLVAGFTMMALAVGGVLAQGSESLNDELRGEVKAAIDRGLGYLRWSQAEDGSWGANLGLTAMALQAFTDSHRGYIEADGPFIRRPLAYLRQSQSEIGAFVPGDTSRLLDAAMIRFALGLFEDPAGASPEVDKAYLRMGLVSQDQFKESPDVFELVALLLAEGLDGELDPYVRELSVLALARLQNPSNDWGFVRTLDSGEVSADATAMGLFALLLSGVSESDVRVQRAIAWLGSRYALTRKDAIESAGFYRYGFALANAFHLLGRTSLDDDQGNAHYWRNDLSRILADSQEYDGRWTGQGEEAEADLASTFATLAPELIYNNPIR